MTEDKTNVTFAIGQIVRARLPGYAEVSRKGTVADIDDESMLLLWDVNEVEHIPEIATILGSNTKQSRFIPCPLLQCIATNPKTLTTALNTDTRSDEMECTVPIRDASPLLDFELAKQHHDCIQTAHGEAKKVDLSMVALWKDRGDRLLRLGDAGSAVSYYEVALTLSSMLLIGGSILIRERDDHKIYSADVDCIDDGCLEITLSETGQERTLRRDSAILLAVLHPDPDYLQPRIMLNTTRCLLKLAETTRSNSIGRPQYLKFACGLCSMIITIASIRQADNDGFANRVSSTANDSANFSIPWNTTLRTALMLRSQAYAGLQQYPHAIRDTKDVLAMEANNREAKRQLADLEGKQARFLRANKKLAKEMSQWVQTQMDASAAMPSAPSPVSVPQPNYRSTSMKSEKRTANAFFTLPFIATVIAIAWFVHKSSKS